MARKMLRDGEQQEYDFDLFVIGAGSGGVRASRTSAAFGAKVSVFHLPSLLFLLKLLNQTLFFLLFNSHNLILLSFPNRWLFVSFLSILLARRSSAELVGRKFYFLLTSCCSK